MTYPSNSDSVGQDQLRAFVERIERMDEELRAINDDKSEIYKEAKATGFDVKVLRKLIADRRKDHAELTEFEALYDLYAAALGMRSGTSIALTRAPAPARTIEHQISPSTENVSPEQPSLNEAVRGANEGGDHVATPAPGTLKIEPDADMRNSAGIADMVIENDGKERADAQALGSDVEPVAPSKPPLRPWCLRPGNSCAGQGHQHCHGCLKAHADAEGLSA